MRAASFEELLSYTTTLESRSIPRSPIRRLHASASLPEPNALAQAAASTQRAPGTRFSSNALRARASRTMNCLPISGFARAVGSRSNSGRGYVRLLSAASAEQATRASKGK